MFLSRLQLVQINAAGLILKKKKSTRATPLLKELHGYLLLNASTINVLCFFLNVFTALRLTMYEKLYIYNSQEDPYAQQRIPSC